MAAYVLFLFVTLVMTGGEMIEAVIFDVGGVLIRTENYAPRRKLEGRLGLASGTSERLVFSGEMGTKAQVGAISHDELWTWIGKHLQLDKEALRRFRREFWAGDVLDEDLVHYIRGLRPRYQTAVISNATDRLRKTLEETYEIADAFDVIVCSAEEKVMKPSTEIYQRTLERLGRQPSETVFVDDFQSNVEAARSVGMQAIHYRPGMDVPSALAELGIETPERDSELLEKDND